MSVGRVEPESVKHSSVFVDESHLRGSAKGEGEAGAIFVRSKEQAMQMKAFSFDSRLSYCSVRSPVHFSWYQVSHFSHSIPLMTFFPHPLRPHTAEFSTEDMLNGEVKSCYDRYKYM